MSLIATNDADVVVVGGGVAGLAAASALEHRDLVLLEVEDRLGGRLHSLARGETWLNLGAHVLTGGESTIGRLVADAGLDVLPLPGSTSALWFEGRLHRQRRVEAYPFVLPLSLRERRDLVRCGSALRLGVARWHLAARQRRGESRASYAGRLRGYRSERTFAEMLGTASPRVAGIFQTVARRSAGEAHRLTEGGAIALFGALWVSGGAASVVNIAGGSGTFGEAWQRRLGPRAKTGARLTSIIERRDEVRLEYEESSGRRRALTARGAVVAVPARTAADVVADLPADARQQLQAVEYGSFVCLAVLTRPVPAQPWDGCYAIATPGAEFDMLFHHSNPVLPRARGATTPRSLMCYAGGDKAAALMDLDDEEVRRRFLAQVGQVLAGVEQVVAEAVVMKWRFGNCYPTPGRSLAAVERWNRRAGGRVVLAGDYFGPMGGTVEAAATSGIASAAMLPNAGGATAVAVHRPGSRDRTRRHD